jgi:hypothetical protein
MLIALASACSLLTGAEIARVQGETPSQAKPSSGEQTGLQVWQCFYALPTFTRSISLELTRGSGVRELWRKRFHEREEKEEKEPPPDRVRGVGEEAFWAGDARMGGLYVLRKDAMIRLAAGGAESKAQKLKRLKRLARKALSRL